MSNIFDMEPAMSRLSFQEKMLYAQLVCLIGLVAFYLHFLNNTPPGHHFFHAVLLGVLLLFASFRLLMRRGLTAGPAGTCVPPCTGSWCAGACERP